MSYALADFDPWSVMGGHTLDNDEIYVLRLVCDGLPLKQGADLRLFARAAGQAQNMDLDVRAVGALARDPSGTSWVLDVVFGRVGGTRLLLPLITNDAAAMAKGIAADPQVAAAFPTLKIIGAEFGRLTGPKDAIDTWRSQPTLWDHSLPGAAGRGGPTATFASPADLSFFQGKADEGRQTRPWKVEDPPVKPDDKKKPAPGDDTAWYILGGVVLVGAGLLFWKRRK